MRKKRKKRENRKDEDLGKALRDAAHPHPIHGGEAWQGEPPDGKCQKHINFKTN